MCVKNNGNKSANSPSWSLSDATYASAVELTKHLMKQYNIDINHVIRHFDVNGKACPGIIGWNTYPGNNENKWLQFKNDLVSTKATSAAPTAAQGEPKYEFNQNIKDLQRALNQDGAFGSKTKQCVKGFQKSHGLTDDGVVGQKTMMAIVRLYVPNAE